MGRGHHLHLWWHAETLFADADLHRIRIIAIHWDDI